MNRILGITKRILTEMVRDKRTTLMIILAPVLVMWLFSVVFSTSSNETVKLGTLDVQSSLVKELKSVKHVKVIKYDDDNEAQKAVKNENVYAFIKQSKQKLDVTYANTNSSKTALTKGGIQASITKDVMSNLSNKLQTLINKTSIKSNDSSNQTKGVKNVSNEMVGNKQGFTIHNHYLYGDSSTSYFNTLVPIFIGFFVFLFVFLVSGMSLLKERTSGTLYRLLATPVRRSEIIFGYLISYGIISLIQTIVIVFTIVNLLSIEVVGSIIWVIIISILVALVALSFGLLLSTLANSEFQMMQFLPIVVAPQLFLSGMIPLNTLPNWLNFVSHFLPLRYASDAQSKIIFNGGGWNAIQGDVYALLIFIMALTILNIFGLRRYRKV